MIGRHRTRNSDEQTVIEKLDNAVVINMTLVIDYNNIKLMKMPILRDLHFFYYLGSHVVHSFIWYE